MNMKLTSTARRHNSALIGTAFMLAPFAAVLPGCQSDAGTFSGLGAAAGAGLGAIIGHQSGHAGEGALIGAGAGAVTGYVIGNESDKHRIERSQRPNYDY